MNDNGVFVRDRERETNARCAAGVMENSRMQLRLEVPNVTLLESQDEERGVRDLSGSHHAPRCFEHFDVA
ncbi:hypothetical protein EYF80_050038 [Liparis tanakae]|uniref:Uncharacterized protein n=1 Tax=Liparis tanakae TaxID=230148 RepID=A0A4Z2FGB4_9TELE|nr:hypothetical protein EYF80_050038 [Liparis tanakae]